MPDTFRILHISDLHFASKPWQVGFPDVVYLRQYSQAQVRAWEPSSHNPHIAEALARFTFLNSDDFDLILITGDIATTGKYVDLLPARTFVLETPARGWLTAKGQATLQGAGRPIRLIPGNHDRFRDGPFKRPGSKHFDLVFASRWDGSRRVKTLAVLQGTDSEQLAIIGVDCCLTNRNDASGILGYLGQGRVNGQDHELEAEVYSLRQTYGSLAILVAVHFPPDFPQLAAVLKLRDDDLLVAAAARIGQTHFLCGHTHEQRAYVLSAGIPVHCAGTATQYVAPNGNVIHLREFDVTGDTIDEMRTTDYYYQSGDFLPAP